MLLAALHLLVCAVYVVLPVAAAVFALLYRWRCRGAAGAVAVAFIAGFGVAVTLNLVYATGTRGRLIPSQILLATYFAAGMFLVLRLLDQGIRSSARRALGLHRPDSTLLRRTRVLIGGTVRVIVLFAVGMPYVMATVMIYRPKVAPFDDPRTQLGFDFQRVEFETSDGVKIVGWWIPAQQPPRRAPKDDDWGTQTALVCHGLASSKSNQLILARRLVPGGYNVLAFDFRAHGESGGQLATFGAKEKLDVLAAVKWLRAAQPVGAKRIVGVGASMGAAALISAAGDDSSEGRAIAAVASYACYDDLWDMTRSAADQYFSPPLNWLLLHIGLPVASVQSGADLIHYAPAKDAAAVWPRPLLLLHGERDDIIDFARGQALLDAASQPKFHVFFTEGSHNDIVENETAAKIVLEFFRTAAPVPVI